MHDMSPIGLFLQAGAVGKAVLILLLLLTLWCFGLLAETWWSAAMLRRTIRRARENGVDPHFDRLMARGQAAAAIDHEGETLTERRARVAEAMHRDAGELAARAERGLPNLAIIASAAPFIGLFGTVWGIMTSFTGIAQSQDTSLAVVAPGIAEALAATAMGLAAAIPASIGYTRLSASLAAAAQALGRAIDERVAEVARPMKSAPRPAREP